MNATIEFLGYAVGTMIAIGTLSVVYLEALAVFLRIPKAPWRGCPRCRKGALDRVAAHSDGRRFYLCDGCGSRYQRSERDGELHDASTPADDAAFAQNMPGGRVVKLSLPIAVETSWTRTVATLLRSKRAREGAGSTRRVRRNKIEPAHLPPLWDSELDGAS
jgi:hypothetical protein